MMRAVESSSSPAVGSFEDQHGRGAEHGSREGDPASLAAADFALCRAHEYGNG